MSADATASLTSTVGASAGMSADATASLTSTVGASEGASASLTSTVGASGEVVSKALSILFVISSVKPTFRFCSGLLDLSIKSKDETGSLFW